MATATLQERQEQRTQDIETNRDLGVFQQDRQATDVVYEVLDGRHRLNNGQTLGPGMRFHPTHEQVAGNTLRGKVRELTAREVRELRTASRSFAGANFKEMELKSLPTLTGRVLAFAVENDLTLADFEGTTPSGAGGNYTKADVEAIIANRAN